MLINSLGGWITYPSLFIITSIK